ncbi:ABC transporter permease [Tsukamurella sp. 8F]|uniref:FtsX-like permease family protein n=1 Tax=unclassified Tsukamurella TaxID=2633480 RepID=UPI0023B9F85A|nr:MULTISPECIES: ABC transporter permease [unclassified Tsukamurella]MDF0530055.1 ABC transporter permease [Tsukamurella sp. 8J]MDF0586373.1 ABC transporter permease [Tsukamurella sp. 8F]
MRRAGRLLRNVVANLAGLRSRYIGLVLLVAVCVAVALAGITVADRSEGIYLNRLDAAVASRTVIVDASAAHPKLTDADVAAVRGHSADATGNVFLSGELQLARLASTETTALYSFRTEMPPPIVAGALPQDLGGAIVVPARLHGRDMRPYLGTRVVVLTNRSLSPGHTESVRHVVTVAALYDERWQVDSTNASYIAGATAREWLRDVAGSGSPDGLPDGYASISAVFATQQEADRTLRELQAAGYRANLQIQMSAEVPESLQSFVALAAVFRTVMIAVGLLVLWLFVRQMLRARGYEIGIRCAAGWSVPRVGLMIGLECAVAALVGFALGVLGSIAVAYAVVRGFVSGSFLEAGDLILPTVLPSVLGLLLIPLVCGLVALASTLMTSSTKAVGLLLSPKE